MSEGNEVTLSEKSAGFTAAKANLACVEEGPQSRSESKGGGESAISGRVAVFCFSSAGELDVMLPLLKTAGVSEFTVVVFKQEILRKIEEDTFYRRLVEGKLENRAIPKVSPRKIRRWLQFVANALIAFWRFRKHDLFFFEYGHSGREKNILIVLLVLFGRARNIFFYPHGHSVTPDSAYAMEKWPPIARYGAKHGTRIVKLNGSAPDRHFVGIEYPILHPDWKVFVNSNVPQLYQNHVVILSRDVHPDYLLEENRSQMLADVVEVLSSRFPEARLVMKAHPREVFAARSIRVQGKEVEVTYENTYSVVRGARLVVSFWTSAFFQCLALNVPVVEYHIAHDRFRSLYPGRSLYSDYILSFQSKEELAHYADALSKRARQPTL